MFNWNRWPQKPAQWQDERIRSAAALLSLDPGVVVAPESIAEAERRLQEVADCHGLDPDQLHRAMTEHEPILGFQEEDHILQQSMFIRLF